jgi:hypothetical protein
MIYAIATSTRGLICKFSAMLHYHAQVARRQDWLKLACNET